MTGCGGVPTAIITISALVLAGCGKTAEKQNTTETNNNIDNANESKDDKTKKQDLLWSSIFVTLEPNSISKKKCFRKNRVLRSVFKAGTIMKFRL